MTASSFSGQSIHNSSMVANWYLRFERSCSPVCDLREPWLGIQRILKRSLPTPIEYGPRSSFGPHRGRSFQLLYETRLRPRSLPGGWKPPPHFTASPRWQGAETMIMAVDLLSLRIHFRHCGVQLTIHHSSRFSRLKFGIFHVPSCLRTWYNAIDEPCISWLEPPKAPGRDFADLAPPAR